MTHPRPAPPCATAPFRLSAVAGLPLASAACSAGLVVLALACGVSDSSFDENGVPEYTGALTPPSRGVAGAPGAVGSSGNGSNAGSPTPSGSNEGPGSLPVANGTANSGAANGGAANSGAANGGAANGGAANGGAANGAGGSAMVGPASAGATSAPADPNGGAGSGNPGTPPVDAVPPPVQPPPQAPPPVLPGGFYLIDDFEGGRDPQWTESEVGGGAGTFTIDTAVGANGSRSSVRIDSNNAFHTMLQFALPQAVRDANEVFGRVYLRLAAAPSQGHFIWVEVGSTMNDQHEMRLGHNVGRLQSNHFLNGEQDIRDQNRQLVANQWYCLEFSMDNNPEQLRVWLDGEETALSTTNYTAGAGAQGNTNPIADFIPILDAFRIGWELQNGTVWFDDVALANARIGCE